MRKHSILKPKAARGSLAFPSCSCFVPPSRSPELRAKGQPDEIPV